jgi:hypothetical protein
MQIRHAGRTDAGAISPRSMDIPLNSALFFKERMKKRGARRRERRKREEKEEKDKKDKPSVAGVATARRN